MDMQLIVTIVRCGFKVSALTSQKSSMKLCKIQTSPAFATLVKSGLFIDAFIVSGVSVFGPCFVILYFHLRFTINGMILILK